MAVTVHEQSAVELAAAPPRRSPAPGRKPFRDNTKLLLLGIAILRRACSAAC